MEQVEKQAPPEPDYFAYSPTHQFYSTNSSPVKTNLSRQSSYRVSEIKSLAYCDNNLVLETALNCTASKQGRFPDVMSWTICYI